MTCWNKTSKRETSLAAIQGLPEKKIHPRGTVQTQMVRERGEGVSIASDLGAGANSAPLGELQKITTKAHGKEKSERSRKSTGKKGDGVYNR